MVLISTHRISRLLLVMFVLAALKHSIDFALSFDSCSSVESSVKKNKSSNVENHLSQSFFCDKLTVKSLKTNFLHHPTPLEERLTRQDAPPFAFVDPINCKPSYASFAGETWLREAGVSNTSNASNRVRQVAAGLLLAANKMLGRHTITCVEHLAQESLSIYNTEAKSELASQLRLSPGIKFVSSEYFPDSGLKSGDIVDGVRHEDLQATSFANQTFDIVMSTEVFEHIPFPYDAHREVFRILRPGGVHVFSVPYVGDSSKDIVMSRMDRETEKIVHGPGRPPDFLAPMFHGDYMRPEGVLVFTLFGQQMVHRLCNIGFTVEVRNLYDPRSGIFGSGSTIFFAWKH